jgi:hypothetical protein
MWIKSKLFCTKIILHFSFSLEQKICHQQFGRFNSGRTTASQCPLDGRMVGKQNRIGRSWEEKYFPYWE